MFTKTKAVFFAREEEDLICCFFLSPPDLYFKCKVLLSWMLSYCLKRYAPKEKRKRKKKVLLPLLCQSTGVETSCREEVLGKSVQEEPIFVLILSKETNNGLRQKEYGL